MAIVSRTAALALALIGARAGALPPMPMGRCVGATPAAPPAAAGPAVNFLRIPNGPEFLRALASLGYKTDERTGTAADPQGRTVTERYVEWLAAPADFSEERVPATVWNPFMMDGYRLDEATCHLSKPPEPPVTRIGLMLFRRQSTAQLQQTAIENLQARLSGLSASSPIPASLREQMSEMQKAGVALPPDLQKALHARGATVGSLSRSVDAAYLSQTRLFDGQRTLQDLAAAARPSAWTPGTPSGRPAPLRPEEQKIGDLLKADVASRFSQSATGRELLSHFKVKDGSIHLPTMLVLKANQRPDEHGEYGAYYDPSHNTMVLNHWQAEASLLAALSPEERKRVGQSFSDPHALRLYLENHPTERAQVLGDIDEIFYHELVHAWQDRRDRLSVETVRGNAPGSVIIAKEHEAYREQCRYDFDKASRDPDALMRSGYAGFCLAMLKDYDSFRDSISRLYMSSFAGSDDFSNIVRTQAARESATWRLMGDGFYQAAVSGLRLIGLWHGDAALQASHSDYEAREKTFVDATLPEIRREALATLPAQYEKENRFNWAVLILSNLPADTPGLDAALKRWAEAVAPTLEKEPKDDAALQERIDEFNFYVVQINAKRAAWTEPLVKAYQRDVRAYVSLLLKKAAAEPAQRAALLANAESWCRALPKEDPLHARVEAAKKGASK